MNNLNNEINDLRKLILQLKSEIDKLKPVNIMNNRLWKPSSTYIMQGNRK